MDPTRHVEYPFFHAVRDDVLQQLFGLAPQQEGGRAQLLVQHVQFDVGDHRQHRSGGVEAHMRPHVGGDLLAWATVTGYAGAAPGL
jgi:hypothetical protein